MEIHKGHLKVVNSLHEIVILQSFYWHYLHVIVLFEAELNKYNYIHLIPGYLYKMFDPHSLCHIDIQKI